MTFVVVGGGPTGVELAGALGEIAHDTLRRDFRSIRPGDARIVLVEALDRILPTYPPDRSQLRRPASSRRLGVKVRTDNDPGRPCRRAPVRVEADGGEQEIPTRTVLWAAGVQASSVRQAVGGRPAPRWTRRSGSRSVPT